MNKVGSYATIDAQRSCEALNRAANDASLRSPIRDISTIIARCSRAGGKFRPGDRFIVLSPPRRSPNVLTALKAASELGGSSGSPAAKSRLTRPSKRKAG